MAEAGWVKRLNAEVCRWAEEHQAWRQGKIDAGEFPPAVGVRETMPETTTPAATAPHHDTLLQAAEHFALNIPEIIGLGMKVWASVQAILAGAAATQVIRGLKIAGRKGRLTLRWDPEA